MIESGSCGSALISTMSECDAALTAFETLLAGIAYDRTSYTTSLSPPGCFLEHGLDLYVFGGGSTGSCSSIKQCICKSTSP